MRQEDEFLFYKKYINDILRIFNDKTIYVLPHPNNSSNLIKSINGENVNYLDNSLSGEEYLIKYNIPIVCSVFSTILFRARKMGVRCFTFGTDELLLKLEPFENSNRIPIILARHFFPKLDELPSLNGKDEFTENLLNFKVNQNLISEIHEAMSLLIKPNLKDVIDPKIIDCLDKLSKYEKGLMLSKGGYKNLTTFRPLKYGTVSYFQDNSSISIKSDNTKNQQKLIDELNRKINNLTTQVRNEKEKRERIKNSLSWKITKPLRLIGKNLHKNA